MLKIEQLNPHACKTYLLTSPESTETVIIDPVINHVLEYYELLNKRNSKLKYIIDTHTHADHISGAPSLKDLTGAELIMSEVSPAQCITLRVKNGQQIPFGKSVLQFISTPGHTKDAISVVLSNENALFTGDSLFLDDGGAGRDDLPGGDPGEHYETLQKIMKLPETLIIYPAHDYRKRSPSPLKQQKQSNPHLKSRTKQQFIDYLNDLKLGPANWMKDVLNANYKCARDPKAAWIPVDSPACEVQIAKDLGTNTRKVVPISPNQLKKKLDAGEKPFLLDVREPPELRSPLGALPGVINISIIKLANNIDLIADKKNQEIVIICRSGARAFSMAQILEQGGFQNIKVLEGGMLAWRAMFG